MSCYKMENIYIIYACLTIYKITESKEKAIQYLEECKRKFPSCSMTIAMVPKVV